ncbi:MAG: hypothetical protein EBU64_03200, partial [Burkholderiaceae bacterium]|nr:hypothetical protein [Burkholderiaceae bacterium]
LEAREGALIFFRDNKIRLCGNCSVWESPLYTTGAPVAQPMADRHYAGCARDTINFFDYSIVRYAGVTRTWSFPGATYVSSPTALRPKVVYPGPGYYSVSLTVTNAAAQTHTRTIDSMIIVTANHCAADTVAGTCLQMNGTNQTVNLGKANINSNTFSISCWVQPTGNQSSFSQIVSHDLYPGSAGYGFGLGVAVRKERGVAAINGNIGDFTWNGAYGTIFWADPVEKLVVVMMGTATGEIRKTHREQVNALIYGALNK